ncbi:NYN domain [Acholeplasma oculi]|uniref:NYN and OST-HTH domain containing protein n=1 Tax=Acholeplasma oculi TaxID=35623 RepID=A0A061AG32_9MOLU|nr:NYN domain-containing protein [Acholeplasma oculi]CDR30531.1 NYN and OST-HTH domain containing protein [Acholeplasma oculi]SKC47519.1 OST-HTH/LOTUS domain-containing protein [Acholeplasma oculi]SUT89192.1 NYN domain [Acholeplasma oculi]
MMNERDYRLALLIDADNVSPVYLDIIINEANKHGKITNARIYGDWSEERLKTWKSKAEKYSLTFIQQYANLSNKGNASDFTLVIDAMDLLYSGKVNAFCIVSSDSDFTKLIIRLKEDDMYLIGMGESKTPEVLVNSYERFYYIDQILEASEPKKERKDLNGKSLIPKKEIIIKDLKKIIDDNLEDDGWAYWSIVADQLRKKYPGFDPINYGSKLKALNFFKMFKDFEIKNEDKVAYIRIRQD